MPARFSRWELTQLEGARPRRPPGFVAFPTPAENRGLSIRGLRESLGVDPASVPCFFDHPWYMEEPFGLRPCPSGWHVIRTEPVPETLGQPVFSVEKLKPDGLYLPTAAEVVLMLALYLALTGERLLLRKHTWTSDRTRGKRFVSVGAFGPKGLFVSSHEVGYRSRGLGICPKIDPPSEVD